MESSFRILQLVRIAMLVSIVLYVIVGEVVAGKATGIREPNGGFYLALTLIAITVVGAVFAVRRALVLSREEVLATRPDDPPTLARWRTGYIITYAMSEAVALFGLVLRLLGSRLAQAAPFYVAGFALILFFSPRLPSSEIR